MSAAENTTPASVVVASGANQLVVDALVHGSGSGVTATVGAGQTQRSNLNETTNVKGAVSTEPGATSVTMSWDLVPATGHWALIGLPLNPVRDAASVPSFYMGNMVLITKADGAPKDRIVLVSPKQINVFDADTGVSIATATPPANESYTGSVAKHKGFLYFGQEGDAAHATPRQATGCRRYDIKLATFGTFTNSANFMSRVLSSRNTFWWVQNKTLGGVPVVRAVATPTDPPPADTAGPFDLSPGNYCTGLMRFGYWVRAAMADGNLHGIDEEGVSAPFLPEVTAVPGTQMGSHIVGFLDRLAIAAPGRIYSLDLASLEVAEITPPVMQGEVDWTPDDNTPALFSDGVELWAAVHDVVPPAGTNAIALWRFLQYPDGRVAWHKIARLEGGATEYLNAQAVLVWDSGPGGRFAFVLCQRSTTTTGLVFKVRVPRAGRAGEITTAFQTSGVELITSYYRAREMVSAKYLQVRGFQRVAPSPSQSFAFNLDNGTSIALGTVTAAGPFSLPFPPTLTSLGRLLRLTLSGDPGHMALPMFIDYLTIPSATDDITIDVLAGDNVVNSRGNTFRQEGGRLGTVENLRALKGQIKNIAFLDAIDAAGKPMEWTVLVVDVEVGGFERGGHRPDEARVSLLVRRL